jgi:Zn/Cd-binding protein ZinT
MIINTDEDMIVGMYVHEGRLTDYDGKWQKVSFKVMREATLEEYLTYGEEYGNKPINMDILGSKFYQISID